ncbi:GNAT superfamily N-acetyltransferase [Paenibacillus turicensis]|uniref:GNAT superfamily N-acetyltransferase n=1 Tax=Paenibacillus turicensis TaxID=160487 RepID=A0ABS4FTE1_9BACL|nr:GNAT family N-acetyltransferase [Paenibacillus turicensis]MBP1905832.1 GNAT superfamily N-acetyltransferase [Paenibacillus turicensis]
MITYKLGQEITAPQLIELFRSSGIKRPLDQPERINNMIKHCDILYTAWDNDTLVGVARAISDFSYCCYLSDLAVAKSHQQQGIGEALIQHVRDQLGDEVSLLLLSAPSAMDYYPKVGFELANNAFLIKRKR